MAWRTWCHPTGYTNVFQVILLKFTDSACRIINLANFNVRCFRYFFTYDIGRRYDIGGRQVVGSPDGKLLPPPIRVHATPEESVKSAMRNLYVSYN